MKYLKKVTAGLVTLSMLMSLFCNFTLTASADGNALELVKENHTISFDGTDYKVGDQYRNKDGEWLLVDDSVELENIAVLYNLSKKDATEITRYNIKLSSDIDMSSMDDWKIAIGTVDCPFNKEFDGDDHTIDYLTTNKNLITSDGGLFGVTGPDAVLHDFIVDHAKVDSVLRGGVVVGMATGSQIYNVSVKNSTLKLRSGGVGVELITAGGIRGGAIAGGAIQNAYLYNCTSYNSKVHVDSDAGLSALSGDAFYLGGLVGNLLGSTIEYSRVTGDNKGVTAPLDKDLGDSDINKELLESDYTAQVHTRYSTGVSALGGLKLYAGGIAGQMDTDTVEYADAHGRAGNGEKVQSAIIDCFANAHVGYYGRMTVSVGAGVSGAAGGIVGRMTDANGIIERCQFAGLLTSRVWNNVLGIGGYTNNSHLGGIVGELNGKAVPNVKNCYYDWDRAAAGKSKAQIPAVQGVSASSCEMVSHSSYNYQPAWVAREYDFDDTHKRVKQDADYIHTVNGGQHYNRWVIDNNETMLMPVHGFGLSAMTDFPGAGTIAIEGTAYRDEVSTDGYKDAENKIAGQVITQQIFPDPDPNTDTPNVTAKATLTATVNETAGEADFVFHGWTQTNAAGEIVAKYELVKGEDGAEHWQVTHYDGETPREPQNYDNAVKDSDGKYTLTADFNSGDTFTANYKAEIVFHVLADGTKDSEKDVTYPVTVEYGYKERMKYIEDPYISGLAFKHWTRTECDTKFDNISSLPPKESARFQVTEPVDLYAAFVDAANGNIHVSVQSSYTEENRDKPESASAPEGQATGNVTGNDKVELNVISNKIIDGTGEDARTDHDTYTGEKYTDPSSYRFLGWWEKIGDEWIQISQADSSDPEGENNRQLKLDDVDVSVPHYYQARYEYRVRLWIPVKISNRYYYGEQSGVAGSEASLYQTLWATYNEDIKDKLPTDVSFYFYGSGKINFVRWTSKIDVPYVFTESELVKQKDKKAGDGTLAYPEFAELITKPTDLCEIVETNDKINEDLSVVGLTDFDIPEAVQTEVGKGSLSTHTKFTLTLNPNYNYYGSEWYRLGQNKEQDKTFILSGWKKAEDSGSYAASEDKYNGPAVGNSAWNFDTNYMNIIHARISANIYQYDKTGELMNGGADMSIYSNPQGWTTDVTAARKYDSRLFNNGREITEAESAPGVEQVEITNATHPVGTGNVINDSDKMYVDGYKFLGWTSKTNAAAFEGWDSTAWTTGDRPIKQEYIVNNTDQTVGKLLAANTRVHNAMWLYPVYAEFKIITETNVEGIDNPTYSINAGTQDDIATIRLAEAKPGYTIKDVDIYEGEGDNKKLVMTVHDINGNTCKSGQLDPDEIYTIVANYDVDVTFHNVTDGKNKKTVCTGGDAIGEMPESKLKAALDNGYVFVGWTTETPADGQAYVDGTVNKDVTLVGEDDKVTQPLDLYPVYAKPSIKVIAYLDNNNKAELTGAVTVKNGEAVIKVPDTYSFNGNSYGICEIRPAEESTGIEAASGNSLSFKPNANTEYVFYAVYGPTVTYKIPSVTADGIVYDAADDITENVPYNTEKKLYYYGEDSEDKSIDVLPAANTGVLNGLVNTRYEFKNSWNTEKTENAADALEKNIIVTENITLYPVIGVSSNIPIYSNLNNAVIGRKAENALAELSETELAVLNPDNSTNKEYTEFVGFALVDTADGAKCEALYPAGTSGVELSEYTAGNATKKIYAVWSQQKTHGISTHVTGEGSVYTYGAMRALTQVRTEILDKVGITVKDKTQSFSEFGRGALFALKGDVEGKLFEKNGSELVYVDIPCDTSESKPVWIGAQYLTPDTGWNVFSVAGGLSEDSPLIGENLSFRGYLVFHYTNGGEKTVYASFDANTNSVIVQEPVTGGE